MSIPVLVEVVGSNGFRAASGAPLAMSVEAPTREAALAKLRDQLSSRLRDGAELVDLELAPPPQEKNPWIKYAGMFKDNPMFDEVVEIMAEIVARTIRTHEPTRT